ncbi:MAG: hypothetical protein ACJ74Y_18655 [Bryobacteraceae bacterium]
MTSRFLTKAIVPLIASSVLLNSMGLELARAQESAEIAALMIVVVQGEGALNNIKTGTAREPIVRVEDRDHRPVIGAVVTFTAPQQGASGAFLNGTRMIQSVTDVNGQAVARGLHPNSVSGQFQIDVSATYDGKFAPHVAIHQSNFQPVPTTHWGLTPKQWIIVGVAAGAAAGTTIGLTRPGTGTTITAGAPSGTSTVGAPQ